MAIVNDTVTFTIKTPTAEKPPPPSPLTIIFVVAGALVLGTIAYLAVRK